jgi:hypothetical protein
MHLIAKKWKKSLFYEEKSLVGLTPGLVLGFIPILTSKVTSNNNLRNLIVTFFQD